MPDTGSRKKNKKRIRLQAPKRVGPPVKNQGPSNQVDRSQAIGYYKIMKVNEWGVFVERPDSSTYEIRLSEDLATKVWKYIEKLKEDDEHILSGNTKGKITW